MGLAHSNHFCNFDLAKKQDQRSTIHLFKHNLMSFKLLLTLLELLTEQSSRWRSSFTTMPKQPALPVLQGRRLLIGFLCCSGFFEWLICSRCISLIVTLIYGNETLMLFSAYTIDSRKTQISHHLWWVRYSGKESFSGN